MKELELKTNDDILNPITDEILNFLFNRIYPIGYIYMSVDDINPGELFCGTWIRWGSGRVPVGIDKTDSDFDATEKIGGYKSHTHNLSNHTHTISNHVHSQAHTHNSAAHFHSEGAHTHNLDENGAAAIFWRNGAIIHERNQSIGITGWGRYIITGTADTVNENTTQSTRIKGRTAAMTAAANTGSTTPGVTGGVNTDNTGNPTVLLASGEPSNNNTNQQSNVQPYIICYMWKRVS